MWLQKEKKSREHSSLDTWGEGALQWGTETFIKEEETKTYKQSKRIFMGIKSNYYCRLQYIQDSMRKLISALFNSCPYICSTMPVLL